MQPDSGEPSRRRSRSDVAIAVGAPVLGVVGMVVGLRTGDVATALFGAVALVLGLAFAVPLARSRGRDDR